MTTQGNFSVKFIQHATPDSDIAVNDLGTALLAMSNIFERANEILNGDRSSIVLRTRGNRAGSVESMLYLALPISEIGDVVLSSDFIISISAIKDLIISAKGIIGIIKGWKGNQPEIKGSENAGFYYEDENRKVAMDVEVVKLLRDKEIRQGLIDFVNPLNGDTDRIDVIENGARLHSIERHEVDYFIVPKADGNESVKTYTSRQDLSIVTVSLNSQQGWKLREKGSAEVSYQMCDEEFMDSVKNRGRRFGNGDVLTCDIKTTVKTTDARDSTKREIVKVYGHTRKINGPNDLTENEDITIHDQQARQSTLLGM